MCPSISIWLLLILFVNWLEISNIDYSNGTIQGNNIFEFNNSASLGGSLSPNVGGPNEPNQIYIDLSNNKTTQVRRDSWDLGFYGGDDFRVVINGSLYMAAGSTGSTDIDAVTEADVTALQGLVAVGTFNPANVAYVDNPNGDVMATAINEVSATDADNPVYLVNMGSEIGTETPEVGSVAVSGSLRGWKKIRVLRNGDDYVLQYADLNDTTHEEVTISKNAAYNFSFFSMVNNNIVDVEPEKERWDICFSVFTNILTGAGSYGFSDFIFHNRKGGAESYLVNVADFSYESFSSSNLDDNAFLVDQTAIGSNWRDVFSGTHDDTVFFVVKDPNGNIYKIKFLALTNDNGVRGYPEFEFELL